MSNNIIHLRFVQFSQLYKIRHSKALFTMNFYCVNIGTRNIARFVGIYTAILGDNKLLVLRKIKLNFLINTDGQIPSTQLLQKENKEYIEIANADYFVPAIWLLLFKQSDLKEVKIETQDFDGNPCFDVVQMPITSVDSALKNLKESKEFFLDAFDCDRSLLQDYFDNALNLLTGFEFKNLALDSTEYLICQLEEDEWSLLFTALGCDTKAIDAIMKLSGYESGVSPFSVSELYENPSLSRGSQLGNANALDVHCSSIDYRFRFKPE